MMYLSDITQFINQMKEQKPSLEAEQRKGRALLWDKQPIDLDERSEIKTSRVEQTPYVYYQNF
ncbi:DUF3460 family protein [Caballeronia sp. 15715]|uniref:DUF3460 family protein n=1 Tax=unclassified Caballeronia TaxID=2646786 RepID=UPI0039E6B1D9